MLSLSFSVGMSLTETPTHTVLPRALHITQFHGSLCGNLYWYVVILTKPTTHAESHNLLQTKCPQSKSRTHTTPTEKHPPALSAANPLWRNTQTPTSWDDCVMKCKANSCTYLRDKMLISDELSIKTGWYILNHQALFYLPIVSAKKIIHSEENVNSHHPKPISYRMKYAQDSPDDVE